MDPDLPTVILGGEKIPFGEFTYGDQERLATLFSRMAEDTQEGAQARTTITWMALRNADPVRFETVEQVRSLKKVKTPEVQEALRVICVASGLKWGHAEPGEAKPAAPAAETPNPSSSGTGLPVVQS